MELFALWCLIGGLIFMVASSRGLFDDHGKHRHLEFFEVLFLLVTWPLVAWRLVRR
jgi:hypothetical protein